MCVDNVFEDFYAWNFFWLKFLCLNACLLWCFSVLFKIVRPISGESSTKLPIWGHHTQKHRFYGIKRWNTMRKKYSFLEPPIPPWSRWPSDSGKLRGSKNKWIFNFTPYSFQHLKKWLGGDPYSSRYLTYNIRGPHQATFLGAEMNME